MGELIVQGGIENKIYLIRGYKVMLDGRWKGEWHGKIEKILYVSL